MTQRRRFLKAIGLAGAVGLAGCTGDTDTSDTTTSGTTSSQGDSSDEDGSDETDTTTEQGPSVTFGGDDEINMNLSPSVPQKNLYVQYGPVRDHLEGYVESNYDVPEALDANMSVGSNYSAVIQALGSGTADIAETGPFAAALGVDAGNAEVVLQRKGYGSWTYQSIIAVPKDSDVTSLSDLSGKTVAFADRLSTSGCLYPLYDMKTDGDVDIGELPEGNGSQADIDPVFAGGHTKSYALLKKGQVDAAGMGGFVPGIVDDFSGTARKINVHDGLPRAPIVVSSQLGSEAKTALRQAFLDAPDTVYYGADGKEGGDDDLWFSDVREASVDDYQSVIDTAKELGVTPELFESA